MQILARSREHKTHMVTAGNDDSFWVRRPTKVLLQPGDGQKEGERGREREGKAQDTGDRGTRVNTP